jgi:hypothetical protein
LEHDGSRIHSGDPCSAAGSFPDGGAWTATDVDYAVCRRDSGQVGSEARDGSSSGDHGQPGQQSGQPTEAGMVGMMVDGGHLSTLPSESAERRKICTLLRQYFPRRTTGWYIYRMVDPHHVDDQARIWRARS